MNVIKLILISTFTILASFNVRAEVPIFLDGFEDLPTERDALVALYNRTALMVTTGTTTPIGW